MSSRKREKSKKGGNNEETSVRSDEISEQERQEKFERELIWCVEQLELGLRDSKKPDSKQALEAVRILKILRNPTAPLVKKRQAMRHAFGDYRKKMDEEEKKYRMTAKSISLKIGNRDNRKKAQFLKKSACYSTTKTPVCGDSTSLNCSSGTVTSEEQLNSGFKWSSLAAQNPTDTFKFGFNIDDTKACSQTMELDSVCQMVENTGRQLDDINLDSSAMAEGNNTPLDHSSGLLDTEEGQDVSVNYYKLPTSGNSFRFNFDVS